MHISGYARSVVAKPRASRRLIAELAFILRALLDEYEAAGLRKIAGHRAALDLAEWFIGGADIAPTALADARASILAERARYGRSSAGLYWQFCGLPVDALLLMIERGDDESTHVLTYARQSVPKADWAAGTKRVEELQRAARMHAAAVDDSPLGSKKPTAGEQIVLVDGFVAERGKTVDRATLKARLGELGRPSTEHLLAFEERFGGLLLPVSRLDYWREDKAFIEVGVWACIDSDAVARGVQDDVYVLDENGAAWCHSLTDPPMPFGESGEELVTRLVLVARTLQSS